MTGDNPNSRANLRPPWKPGEGGGGRAPCVRKLKTRLREILEQDFPEHLLNTLHPNDFEVLKTLLAARRTGGNLKVQDVADAVLMLGALKGDVKFLKEVLDRIEGPVTQKIEGEFTHTSEIDRMSDEELVMYHQQVMQKRLTIEGPSHRTDPG